MQKYIAVFHLDEEHLKILVSPSRHPRETACVSVVPVRGSSDEEISSGVRKSDAFGLLERSRIVLSIPRHHVTVRTVELPSTDPRELKKMAEFQALRVVPYSQQEIVLGTECLATLSGGKSLVLLVIVHRKIIDRLLGILRRCDLIPLNAVFSSEALLKMLLRMVPASRKKMEGPVAIVEIDCAAAHIALAEGESLVFSRSIPSGQAHARLEDMDESALAAYAGSLRDSFDFSGRSAGKPGIVLLTGPAGLCKNIAPRLGDLFSTEVVQFDLTQKFKFRKKDLEPLKSHSFASVAGSLFPDHCVIDLLPEEVREEKTAIERRRSLKRTGILLAILALISGFLAINELKLRNAYLSRIDAEIKRLEPTVKRLELKKDKMETLKRHMGSSLVSLDVIYELGTLIPKGIFLRNLSYDFSGRVSVKGMAKSMAQIFEWLPKLEASPLFYRVKTKYTRKVKVRGKEYADFQIECTLSPSGAEE